MRSSHKPFNRKAFIDERSDSRKHILADYYAKFDTLLQDVIKPHHPTVIYQGLCGVDRYPHISNKATYMITGDKRFVKLSSDGLLLWRYNKDEQVALSSSCSVDHDLIERLSHPIYNNISKYPDAGIGLSVPFDQYDLLALQEPNILRPSDTTTCIDLCRILSGRANAEKRPLVIRPHPFVPDGAGGLDVFASDYVYIDTDSDPSMLVKNSSSVHGNTSSLLVDAMVMQIPTYTYSGAEFYGGAHGDIDQQNRWLSWYYGVICVDIESHKAKSDILRVLES